MMRRARIILLIVLSMMITACVAVLGSTGPAVSFVPFESHLPGAILILLALLAVLAVSGLMGDLIRGIALKADGTRDALTLTSVVIGISLGIIVGGLVFQFLATLAD